MKKILITLILLFICSSSINAKENRIRRTYVENDNIIFYDTIQKNLFLKSTMFNFHISNKTKNNEWIYVEIFFGDGGFEAVFNIPKKKCINVDNVGTLTDFGSDSEGEFIWVDCRLEKRCEKLEYEGERAYTKVYFKDLIKDMDKWEDAQSYIKKLEKKHEGYKF